MISVPEFRKKQIVFLFAFEGDKLSFSNDNIVIKDKDGKVKHQSTCYKLFMLIVAGNVSITSGLLQRANKFGFSICLMNRNMKLYQVISVAGTGNTLLHKHQYEYVDIAIGKQITKNKILCQREALKTIRSKSFVCKDAIANLEQYARRLESAESINEIMGIEGIAAREYFPSMFSIVEWMGRRPRIKSDYVNATLDIGYNILFNFVDAILTSYGFDTYYGVLHRCFYRRKSLVCDLVEPFRPIIDLKVRKAINLSQFQADDFQIINHQYMLEWKKSPKYVSIFMEEIIKYKDDIFVFIQSYYRAFMKSADIKDFPEFKLK